MGEEGSVGKQGDKGDKETRRQREKKNFPITNHLLTNHPAAIWVIIDYESDRQTIK